MKRIIMEPVEHVYCDLCGEPARSTEDEIQYLMSHCPVCNKDICGRHAELEYTDDGALCPEHAALYEISYTEGGGVGLRDIKTHEWVDGIWRY